MGKHIFLKSNNHGATLIMVVISFVFVAVFGTIIVGAAVKNTQMKAVDRQSKSNFYLAEAALEEIRLGLLEDVAENLSASYQLVLTNYSTNNSAMRKKMFRDEFILGMKTALGVNLGDDAIPLTSLDNYLRETKKLSPSDNGAEIIGTPTLDSISAADSITVKGVALIYTFDGYTTTLETDIKIKIPQDDMNVSSQTPYKDFAIIADEALHAKFTDYDITGNVYAGSRGILTGFGKALKITGNRIISKGDIEVKDFGELDLSGVDTEVWANNLITTQTDKVSETTNETMISITGECYIKDDLVIDAKKSRVTMQGEYYGYSNGRELDSNSAIVINAPEVNLNLLGLSKLYLAGRAYISLDDGSGVVNYNTDDTYGAGDGVNCNILTGESLIIKGSQSAYLLPSEFIVVGHNPVSWSEYTINFDIATNTDQMVAIPPDVIVFEKASISEEMSKLSYYLNETQPVKKAFYKFNANDNVVYYYLNFKSQELATTYFKNYMNCYPDKIYNGFPVDSIKINTTPGAYLSAGNIMMYDTGFQTLRGTNGNFTNNYSKEFQNLITTLHKNIKGNPDPGNDIVFENILDIDKIRNDAVAISDGKILEKEVTIDGETYYVCIVDNETDGAYLFNLTGKKGIIVTTGDINVDRNFTGLIISNKTIELNASMITADPELVNLILTADSEVQRYFRACASMSAAELINVTDLISYENWKKN